MQRFTFTDENYRFISNLMLERVGIHLPVSKRELIYGRLAKRLRHLELDSFEQYCRLLQQDNDEELVQCINALTTNVTAFFRENHHFEYLLNSALPEILKHKTEQNNKRIRVWSAGCSSGEEPYSIAMTIKQSRLFTGDWDIKILATDLDSGILKQARAGVYTTEKLDDSSLSQHRRWFRKGRGRNDGLVTVADEIKAMIHFKRLNLADTAWPMRGPFDIIFCRNVVIYFEREMRQNLIARFHDLLIKDGHLFIGHSESLFGVSERFRSLGNTIHRKIS